MKNAVVRFAAIFIIVFGFFPVFGQNVSDEAKKHFDRGTAALEMAKARADFDAAIKEFEQAARLAPAWPDAFYNLGLAQEGAEKFAEAVQSYRQYLQLAPNARDAEEVKSLINKLEYKMEQVLTIPRIVDILASCGPPGWESFFIDESGSEKQTYTTGLGITRIDDHSVQVKFREFVGGPRDGEIVRRTVPVSGPKFTIIYTDYGLNNFTNEYDACPVSNYIEVISKVLVKVKHIDCAYSTNLEYRKKTIRTAESLPEQPMNKGTGISTAEEKWNKWMGIKPRAKPPEISIEQRKKNARLCWAVHNGDKEGAEASIAEGADINNATDSMHSMPPLYFASSGNLTEMVDLLISKGADINAQFASLGMTPLHYVVRLGLKGKEMAEFLITRGADINAKDEDGETPLHNAATKGKKDIAELLIAKGADINAKDEDGKTPFHNAATEGRKEVVELLIAKGADINAKDKYGRTPLHLATEKGNTEVAELLIAKGADTNAKDLSMQELLRKAASQGKKELVESLIAIGVDINAKDFHRDAPLHWAASSGRKEIVELLIARGADINAKDYDGDSPLKIAEDKGFKEIADFLRKNGAK